MKQQKEENKEKAPAAAPLSETIENAHASGDGALERGKESLLTPEDNEAAPQNNTEEKEAY